MATDRTVMGPGFQLIIASGSLSKKCEEAIKKGLGTISKEYAKQIDDVISLDDHSLEALRALGYPYSTNLPAGGLHGDDRLVHEQTGELRKSIKVSTIETTSRRFSVYIRSDSPYMPYLIFGTSRMRPRRFHELAYERMKSRFWEPVLENLKNVRHRIQAQDRVK